MPHSTILSFITIRHLSLLAFRPQRESIIQRPIPCAMPQSTLSSFTTIRHLSLLALVLLSSAASLLKWLLPSQGIGFRSSDSMSARLTHGPGRLYYEARAHTSEPMPPRHAHGQGRSDDTEAHTSIARGASHAGGGGTCTTSDAPGVASAQLDEIFLCHWESWESLGKKEGGKGSCGQRKEGAHHGD